MDFARNPRATDLSFALDVSSDLVQWAEVPMTETVMATNPDGTTQVRLMETVASAGAARRFARLKVELRP